MKRKHIQGCNCCAQCYDIFTVVVTDTCTGAPIPLATVTASLPGQIPITATTNSGGHAEIRTDTAGTWTFAVSADTYTSVNKTAIADCSGTYKQVDVAMSKSGGTTTLSVSVVNNCTSAAISGATVTATQGTTTVTGTTSSLGSAALTLPRGGDWVVTASKSGFGTQTRTITVTCWTTTLGSFALAATTDTTKITITVRGCNSQPLPGAAITITRGSFTFSGTTNSSGQAVWDHAPSGSWTATAAKARFATGSGSGSAICNNANTGLISLNPATGYHCGGCVDATANSLHLTDPVDGSAITLAYQLFSLQDSWCGCQVVGGIAYYYEIHGGAPTWNLTVSANPSVTTCTGVCIPGGASTQTRQGTASCGTGVPMSVAVPINFSGAGSLLTARWGTGTQTFPVSE